MGIYILTQWKGAHLGPRKGVPIMSKTVEFWRETEKAGDAPKRVIVAAVEQPDNLSDEQALERAEVDFCASHHLLRWQDLAHGYQIRQ